MSELRPEGPVGSVASGIDWQADYTAIIEQIRSSDPFFDTSSGGSDIREALHSLYDSLPMLCKGQECPIASRCPVSHRLDLLGTGCVLEVLQITKRMARYLRDLGLDDVTYTDVQSVIHLVRLDVLIFRIEQILAVEGMTVEEVTVSSRGNITRQVGHPLLEQLKYLMKEQRAVKDELMASRRARLEKRAKESKIERDLVRLLSQFRNRITGGGVIDAEEVRELGSGGGDAIGAGSGSECVGSAGGDVAVAECGVGGPDGDGDGDGTQRASGEGACDAHGGGDL